MKIGIFGGCFNPPHKMHHSIAKELLKEKILDRVIYVPTGNGYQKKDLIKDVDRYNMVKAMIQNEDHIEVSDYEVGNKKYTYETLRHFQEEYPSDTIYFICGTDNLEELDTWKNYTEILEKYKLLIIQRNGDSIEELKKKYPNNQNIISTKINTEYLSSTKVRERLENQDSFKNLQDVLDKSVIEYIENHKLYRK